MKYTINVMHLSHPKTISLRPHPHIHGKIASHETGHCTKKVGTAGLKQCCFMKALLEG